MRRFLSIVGCVWLGAMVVQGGSSTVYVRNHGVGNFSKSRVTDYIKFTGGTAWTYLGTSSGTVAPGPDYVTVFSRSWGTDGQWLVKCDGSPVREGTVSGLTCPDLYFSVLGDGESASGATNTVTVCNPTGHPVRFWMRVDGVEVDFGSNDTPMAPGECITFPVLSQWQGSKIEAGYSELDAVVEWSLENGWHITNGMNDTVQTIATNGPGGWENQGTNVWEGNGNTQPWRTLTNAGWNGINWSAGGTPGALAASDNTLRAGFNGVIGAVNNGDMQLLAGEGMMIDQLRGIGSGVTSLVASVNALRSDITNLSGIGGTNNITITNTPTTNSLDWEEGARVWTEFATENGVREEAAAGWLCAKYSEITAATNGAGVWGDGGFDTGFDDAAGWSFFFPIGESGVTLASNEGAIGSLGGLTRTLLSWLFALLCFKANMVFVERWFQTLVVVPQARTAGQSLLGTNANMGGAFAMGLWIVAALFAFPSFAVAVAGSLYGGENSSFWGLSFPSGTVGTSLAVLTTFVPLASIGAALSGHFGFRVTCNVAGGSVASFIRLCSGL